MTNITELAQRMKAAAVRAKTATEEYASGHMSVSVCFAECEEFNRLTDGPDNILALVEALEKAQQRITQMESRTVKLPKLKMLEDYLAEVAIEERKQILVGVKLEFHRVLNAAGIKVEAE
ncbi:hypothetical protein [Klebsiella pneumoniae]|uniref:hypothetical protein n=1 Tax=Klebsiella pneumoniae TaxID=573 RepID=UPI0027EB8D90|nr:hypothetical protein [Klebsiella pneumoniae]MCP5843603.1 hypothetical protein [Klebsiella pneumoniae]HDU4564400.1 hypothetical protein [Klebsiella pneumoniae subsp. pneumoniae]HDU5950932.1 hypothetical protein [Klebsiella pneumoniae subsp. pneumoniae]HDU6116363.1 hypothetical protein [Klebsiella pneumoniae subsp. pneumoniae]